jgi:signal transduction histidine kinase/ActR/RegA family two-component response regulator
MADWLAFWRAPTLDGGEHAEQLRTAHALLRVGFLILVVATGVSVALRPWPITGHFAYLAFLLIHVLALSLVRRGVLRPTMYAFSALYLLVVLEAMWRLGGVSAPATLALPPLVLFVGLTVSGRAALVTALAASAGAFTMAVLERRGALPPRADVPPERFWIVASGSLAITAFMLYAALRIIRESRAKAAADQQARREMEEHLLQSRRLEAVGRLAAGVAHDFNNVLTVVFAEATRLGRLPGPAATSATNIREAAERASALTRQLLSFGRRQHLEPELLELGDVVRQLEKLLGKFVGDPITVEVELAEDLARVRADRTELEQVLLNLVTNARDAMPNGGVVRIRTGRATLDGGAGVFLSVTDEGTGIDEEVRARLFEPFFTTKEIGKGTGLGLATVHAIVTQLGGEVRVESRPGAGATFTVVLPGVAGTESAASRTVAAPRAMATGARIAIVEDDALVRGAIEQIVVDGGYVATTARSGVELLSAARSWTDPPDLLLTDVMMPDMTGPELVRQLRERHPELRVVFTSGYAEERLSHSGVALDGVHFVAKPFERTALLDKIAAVLADR